MLGFAAELVGEVRPAPCCKQGAHDFVLPWQLWGRFAVVGKARAHVFGLFNTHGVWLQVLTKGKGPLGQLGLPLNLPLNPELAGFGLAIWVGFFLVAGERLRLPKHC